MGYLLELNDKIKAATEEIAKAKALLDKKNAELIELKKMAWYCPNCEKNYPRESVTRSFRETTSIEVVYTDSGYGDDDELAEVTRLTPFLQCPVCGGQYPQEKGSILRERNRHTRR